MIINERELATVLAALRSWQERGDPGGFYSEYFEEYEPLSEDEIDDLCERLNCSDLIDEALEYEAEAFDNDEEVNGADLVDWFAGWRRRVKDELDK